MAGMPGGKGGFASAILQRGVRSAEIDQRCARICGFYFANEHRLIHRHIETVSLNSDESAHWRLQVDFELPTDPAARCGRLGDECFFLFPLMFLRKAEGRTGFYAKDERGMSLALQTRARCDWISATAAAEAAKRLRPKGDSRLPPQELEGVLGQLCGSRPYDASVILNELLNGLEPGVTESWESAGLADDLRALMEHSLVWLPVRGMPGERRVVEVGHDMDLTRQAIVRWRVGRMHRPKHPRLRPRRTRMMNNPAMVLNTGKAIYGRLSYRISFPALGERLVRPLAWVPIQCDFPTIYTHRCDSYHFELTCPKGLSPRDVRLGTDDGDFELEGRKTLRSSAAHLYLPGSRAMGDLSVRVTVGVGAGSFPILWFLAGALTATMLWVLAAASPPILHGTPENTGQNEILASILLGAPAVLAALVVVEEGGIARMIGGARVLLFVPALCSVVATTVLLGATPLGLGAVDTWTACAAVATGATVPLATSWLISSPMAWHQLKKLNTARLQYMLMGLLVAAVVGLVLLLEDHLGSAARAGLAVVLLGTTVPLLLLATNRAAVPITEPRRYVSVSACSAALLCLALGCVELRASFDQGAHLRAVLEPILVLAILVSPFAGLLLELATSPFRPSQEVIDISPEDGRNLIARESLGRLRELRAKIQRATAVSIG